MEIPCKNAQIMVSEARANRANSANSANSAYIREKGVEMDEGKHK